MFDILVLTGFFAVFTVLFAIRYLIGKKFSYGAKFQKQGYRLLRSHQGDACLADTLALCLLIPLVFILCFHGKAVFSAAGPATSGILSGFLVLMFLWARLAERVCVFFNEEGLLLSKPFRQLRFVPWSEIGSIRNQQFCNVLDQRGRRLTWIPLNRKTLPFFELARKNGVPVQIPKDSKMVLDSPSRKPMPGEWNAVLARSAYAKNTVVSFAVFQDFIVVLFMDRELNEDNVIALNRDGTVRWKISDIVRRPISCAAMTAEGSSAICVLTVTSRQYDNVLYTVDVHAQKIVSQRPGSEA